VVAAFDGGRMTSDAGALLLGATDQAIRLVERFADCFTDGRAPDLIEHTVRTLVGQRIFALALGYEDLIDHDQLRHNLTMAVLVGRLAARRQDCAPLAGKSALNRLELGGAVLTRYHRIAWDAAKIEALFVDLFLKAHEHPPKQIILDLDATDDPLHGHQEGRFFHGYYDCYCYLPLYIFCGPHLLAAKQRPANIDAAAGALEEVARLVAQIRARWPEVRIVLRGDSGFARDALMMWCERNGVDFLFGLARNQRLVGEIAAELAAAAEESKASGQPARRFKEFQWSTRDSWSRPRRVIAKAEWTRGAANPRFVVTSLSVEDAAPQRLYEELYCARWRHGRPHQRMPARSVRRPHLGSDAARQSAAAVVCVDGLCVALRAASPRSTANQIRQGELRPNPSQVVEDRRPSAHQRAPHHLRNGLGLSLSTRLCPRPRPTDRRRGALKKQERASRHSTAPIATSLVCAPRLAKVAGPRHSNLRAQLLQTCRPHFNFLSRCEKSGLDWYCGSFFMSLFHWIFSSYSAASASVWAELRKNC
jgi:hypothetical protein